MNTPFAVDFSIEVKRTPLYKEILGYFFPINKSVQENKGVKENRKSDFTVFTDSKKMLVEFKQDEKTSGTGNLAIEYAREDFTPSGLSVTECDCWIHIACMEYQHHYWIYGFTKQQLKELIQNRRQVFVRNENEPGSRIYILPIHDIPSKHKRAELYVENDGTCFLIYENNKIALKEKMYYKD